MSPWCVVAVVGIVALVVGAAWLFLWLDGTPVFLRVVRTDEPVWRLTYHEVGDEDTCAPGTEAPRRNNDNQDDGA